MKKGPRRSSWLFCVTILFIIASGCEHTIEIQLSYDPEYADPDEELVSFAIPFPQGELKSVDRVVLKDPNGNEIPAYVEAIVPWRNINGETGSIRSIYVQFLYNLTNGSSSTLFIHYGPFVRRHGSRPWTSPEASIFQLPDGRGEAMRIWPLVSAQWLTRTMVAGHLTVATENTGFFRDIETSIQDHFQTYRDLEIANPEIDPGCYAYWLYDRVTTTYIHYVRTGFLGLDFLREAFRSARHYNNLIYDESYDPVHRGAFSLKDSLDDQDIDIKYCYTQGPAIHYVLTGDPESLSTISDIRHQLSRHGYLLHYNPAQDTLWTERHFAFRWLGYIFDYMVTGAEESRLEILNHAAAAYSHQGFPPDGYPADGSWRSSEYDRREGDSDTAFLSSPWMTSILIEALLAYFDLSGSPEAVSSILQMADYLKNVGIKRIPDQSWQPVPAPWYLCSTTHPEYNYFEGNESAHNLEVLWMLALARYLGQSKDYDSDIVALYETWLSGYGAGSLCNPPWKFAWTTRGALQFLSMVDDLVPHPPSTDVRFDRLDTTGLGAPQWGFGVGAGDLDNDMYPDVVLLGHPQAGQPGVVEVYRNNHDKTFSLQGVHASPANGVNLLDYNDDGLLDLFVTADGFWNVIYFQNQGAFQFSDPDYPFFNPYAGEVTALAWGDINEDGLLEAASEYTGVGDNRGSKIWRYAPFPERWTYDRMGDFFVPQGMSPRLFDLNGDDKLDLALGRIVGYYTSRAFSVYHNNGTGTFIDVTDMVGLGPLSSLTYDLNPCDLDSDGDLDLISMDYAAMVFENVAGTFVDRTDMSGLPAYQDLKGTPIFADFNNDGLIDIVATKYPGLNGSKLNIYINQGDLRFEKLPGYEDTNRLANVIDIDQDGLLDIVVQSAENRVDMIPTYILLNTCEGGNHWIKIKPTSTNPRNRSAVGAKIWIYQAGRLNDPEGLITYTQYGSFTGSGHDIHLGLGQNTNVDIKVRFPSGQEKELHSVTADQRIEIFEP